MVMEEMLVFLVLNPIQSSTATILNDDSATIAIAGNVVSEGLSGTS